MDSGDRLRGGGFYGDLVGEGFELADESAFARFGVVEAAGEVVGAQILVAGGVGEHMPDDHDQGVGGGDGGLASALLAEPAGGAAGMGADGGGGGAPGPGAPRGGRAEVGGG